MMKRQQLRDEQIGKKQAEIAVGADLLLLPHLPAPVAPDKRDQRVGIDRRTALFRHARR
jgi:hypothetical protein